VISKGALVAADALRSSGGWICHRIWRFPKMGAITPKSSVLMGFSIVKHPAIVGYPYFRKLLYGMDTGIDVCFLNDLGRCFF